MKHFGLFLSVVVIIGWFVSLGMMANYFQKKALSLGPGGGFLFIVYMFAVALSFLFAELLVVLIDYFTNFGSLI